MIRWLNKDVEEHIESTRLREPRSSTARCILDCSISLKPELNDSNGACNAPKRSTPLISIMMNAVTKPDGPLLDDEGLVVETLKGNKEAYRILVERYQNRLLMMVTDILKSREDAEDVVQESFVKAFLSLPNFKGHSSFYTWLYRIAYNMAIDVRRKAARRGGSHVEYREGPGVNKIAGKIGESSEALSNSVQHLQNVEGPDAALVRKETGRRLSEVIGELSEEHRTVIMLREIDGLNYDEIADATGVPRGTVMSRLHYARKALQEALREFAGVSNRTPEPSEALEGSSSSREIIKGSLR